MKKTLLFLSLSCFAGILSAQSISESSYNQVVAVVGDETIKLSELVETYSFNSPEEEITPENIKDFLPSYVDYRMKLKEGYALNMDQNPELLEELENYGRQSAYTFWIENEIRQQIIDEYLEKSRYELRAFHILGAVEPDAAPEDTARVYQQMMEARDNILQGMSLSEADEKYSSIRNGQSMGGQLPWLRSGTTVPEFEEAIFSLSEGEVSEPVRTQFGYHIIKLQEKRERTPDRMVSHIFVQNRPDQSDEQTIEEVHEKLQSGADWFDLVSDYSEDNASISRGGNINWVGYGTQFEEGFVDSVMNIDPEKPFSDPVKSVYGHHILRIDSVRTYLNEEDRKNELLDQLQQRQRLNPDRGQVLDKLKERVNFNANSDHIEQFSEHLSEFSGSTFEDVETDDNQPQKVLFTFDGRSYTYSDFKEWLKENHPQQTPGNYNQMWMDDFIEETLESNLTEITSREFPEFKNELNRFLDGLIVFQISNEHVWDPETADLSSLKDFYEKHKNDYRFDKRFAYYLISSRSESLIEQSHTKVSEGIHPSSLSEQFEDLSIHYDSTRNSNSSSYEQLKKMEEQSASKIFSRGVYKSFYFLDKILEPRTMTFNEAYRRVVSDYQPIREEQFMNYLRDKYDPELYPENIQ